MSGCELCDNCGPLLCDTHAELATLEAQGYLDGLSVFENRKVTDMMTHEQVTKLKMGAEYGRNPKEFAYLKGRRDALVELIEARIE
jgi:hypothetical protein